MKRRAITQADIQASLLANPALRAANPGIEAQLGGVAMGSNRPVTPVLDVSGVKTAPKLPKAKKMTTPEREMLAILQRQVREGEIASVEFEAIKLKVGDDTCFYTPDMAVFLNDGRLRFVETKGPFIREDSVIKFKAAKKQYPHCEFELWQRAKDGAWTQIR